MAIKGAVRSINVLPRLPGDDGHGSALAETEAGRKIQEGHSAVQLPHLTNQRRRHLRFLAPLCVDARRDGFEMIGVDASGIAAEMVKLESVGDWTVRPLEEHPMGVARLAADDDPTVAVLEVRSALPDPAPRLWVNLIPVGMAHVRKACTALTASHVDVSPVGHLIKRAARKGAAALAARMEWFTMIGHSDRLHNRLIRGATPGDAPPSPRHFLALNYTSKEVL